MDIDSNCRPRRKQRDRGTRPKRNADKNPLFVVLQSCAYLPRAGYDSLCHGKYYHHGRHCVVMRYSDFPQTPLAASVSPQRLSLQWSHDCTRVCATRAQYPLPPCCTTLPPPPPSHKSMLLVIWQCGKMEFGCAVYVGVRPLGNWTGEMDFLPLGPFIADL